MAEIAEPMTHVQLNWLMDESTPAVRHLALRQLFDRPADDPDVVEARRAAMAAVPIAPILAAQDPEGWWVKPGAGYSPKYSSTVWSLIFLDQMGADGADPHNGSWFRLGFPSGYVADVLQVLEALCDAGAAGDPRLARAFDWLLAQRGSDGRWTNRYAYQGKLVRDIDRPGKPSKWVTLRALRVLKARAEASAGG